MKKLCGFIGVDWIFWSSQIRKWNKEKWKLPKFIKRVASPKKYELLKSDDSFLEMIVGKKEQGWLKFCRFKRMAKT